MIEDMGDDDYRRLARFRQGLRRYLRFSEGAARAVGLTARQYQALIAVRAAPADGLLIGALAEELMLQPHSVTGMVDRLAEAGLVERIRDTDDRRQVRVVATAKARALLAELVDSHRAELRRMDTLLQELVGAR